MFAITLTHFEISGIYLKVNWNCNVKHKLNSRCLFGKLPRNSRHCMVETSERFLLMGLLQQIVKSSHLEVYCKKSILKNFGKFTGKHPCWSLFLI